MRLSTITAIGSSISVAATSLAALGHASKLLLFSFAGIAAVCITSLLAWSYVFIANAESKIPSRCRYCLRLHIALHLVPAGFLAMKLIYRAPERWDAWYLLLVIAFFWTGRETWRTMYQYTRSIQYLLFFRGNTGLLIMAPIMLTLGHLFPHTFFVHAFERLLLVYFAIHLILTGPAIIKLEKDIEVRTS